MATKTRRGSRNWEDQVQQFKNGTLGGVVLLSRKTPDIQCVCSSNLYNKIYTFHPDWKKPETEWELRTNRTLIQAILDHPKSFTKEIVEIKRHSNTWTETTCQSVRLSVIFVSLQVIEAHAWSIEEEGPFEVLHIHKERLAHHKIRQLTDDPAILKLLELEDGWWIS